MIHFLIHEESDTVGVATADIETGQVAQGLYMDTQKTVDIKSLSSIPLGHKIALGDHAVGDAVIKYGHDIGKVVETIERGAHVHVHNLKTKRW